jgi:GT2 family glycosyltransferase
MSENPRVSVIIPARNEAANIARVVRSVAAQPGVLEIIVADDQSQDGTGEILEGLRAQIPALRVLRIESLPEGWLGKTHAVATAARLAAGDWLLFTDADTEHLAGSLAALLARAEQERADLLSLSPGQEMPTWWEKAVIPLVYVNLARLYRFEEVSDPNSPTAAANGQYVLIRRAAYERAGGHEAVRAAILEDVELARHVKASGGRLLFLPGAAWVRTRMYRSFSEMRRGWTKNLYLLYGQRPGRMLAAVCELCLLDVAPPLALVALCLMIALGRGGAAAMLTALGCFLVAMFRQWSHSGALRRLGFEPRLADYEILGAGLFSLLLLNSLRVYRLGGRVEWKGRHYSTRGAGKETG